MPKQTWSNVKSAVSKLSNRELLSLVGELYRLSKQNQAFLHARYADAEAAMEDCKKIISDCLYPDVLRDRPLQVAKAKKAVSDFCAAVAEPVLHVELMVFFLEQGNAFTVEYGDIDASFYDALLAMARRAVKTIGSLPKELQEPFRVRLAEIVRSSSGIGWGYHDELTEIYRATSLDGN
ncbi:MAG: hypothetical protein R6W06_00680 [Prochlorococcaceae cyanobacterium]